MGETPRPDDDLTLILNGLARYAGDFADASTPLFDAGARLRRINDLMLRLASAGTDRVAVVALVKPDEIDAEGAARWGAVLGGGYLTARPPQPSETGEFGIDLDGYRMSPERAQQLAARLLSAAQHSTAELSTPQRETR